MRALLKMILVLTLMCCFSGFVLSYLKVVTTPIIEEQVLANVQGPAIKSVFPNAENNPLTERKKFTLADGNEVTVFPCKAGNALIGVAIENFGKGYGGPVGVMVGFNIANDTLAGVGMTILKETPGLGMRVKEASFSEQFIGLSTPVALSAQGGKIDAISGATISSNGVVEAVNKSTKIYAELKEQIVKNWQ